FVSSIKRDATALRRLLYDRRAPRIAIVGSPGCGRTTLANALLSAHAFGQDGAAPPPAGPVGPDRCGRAPSRLDGASGGAAAPRAHRARAAALRRDPARRPRRRRRGRRGGRRGGTA